MEHWNKPLFSIYYILYNKYLFLKINHLQRVIPQNTTNFVDLRKLTKLEQMEQMEQKFPPKLHFRNQIKYLHRQPHEKKICNTLCVYVKLCYTVNRQGKFSTPQPNAVT